MHPTAATLAPESAAASSSSIDSCLAAWMKPEVLTRTTSASSPSPRRVQPPAASRAASSSESTSLRAQPSVTRLTVRELGTRRAYVISLRRGATAPGQPGGPGALLVRYQALWGRRCHGRRRDRGTARGGDLRRARRVDVHGHRVHRLGRLVLAVHG